MRSLFRKAGFVFRYLWALACNYPRLRTEGFVFFEPGVSVRVDAGCSILLKKRAYLKRGCVLECTGKGRMVIGEYAAIGLYCFVGCREKVEIGDHASIGQQVIVVDVRHRISRNALFEGQGYYPGKCLIGKRCAVFPQSVVGPDVSIADDSIVLGNSSVVKSISEPGKMWGGNPAKFVKDVEYDD